VGFSSLQELFEFLQGQTGMLPPVDDSSREA
jgi:hypothetical protein